MKNRLLFAFVLTFIFTTGLWAQLLDSSTEYVTGELKYSKTWSKGWTTGLLYSSGSNFEDTKVFLFHHKSGNGTTYIARVQSDLTLGKRIFEGDWSSGWDTMEIIHRVGGSQLYHAKTSNGLERIAAFDPDSGDWEGTFGELDVNHAWDEVCHYVVGGSVPWILNYRKSDGYMEHRRTNNGGSVPLDRGDWATNIQKDLIDLEVAKIDRKPVMIGITAESTLYAYELSTERSGPEAGRVLRSLGSLDLEDNYEELAVYGEYLFALGNNSVQVHVFRIGKGTGRDPLSLTFLGYITPGYGDYDTMDTFWIPNENKSAAVLGLFLLSSTTGEARMYEWSIEQR